MQQLFVLEIEITLVWRFALFCFDLLALETQMNIYNYSACLHPIGILKVVMLLSNRPAR